MDRIDPPCTPASIAAAREAQERERAVFEQESGLRLDADGLVITKKPDFAESGSTDTFER